MGLTLVLTACGGNAGDIARPLTESSAEPSAENLSVVTEPGSTPPTSARSDTRIDAGAVEGTTSATDEPATLGTAATAPPAPTTAVTNDPDAQALAAAAVVRSDDLPGWTRDETPATDPEPPPAGCSQLTAVADTVQGNARATFASPDGAEELTNEVTVHSDDTAADAAIARIDRPSTPGCLERVLVGTTDAFTIDRATVARIPLSDGDRGVAFDATLEVDVDGETYRFAARLEYVRVGRAVSFGMAFAQDQIPDEAGPAFEAVLERLRTGA